MAARGGAASAPPPPAAFNVAGSGMLHPDLAELLRAVQLARVYDDSKTAV